MKDLRKEKIERLERRLLKASRVSDTELRQIVSAPHLLDKINARIKAEEVSGAREKSLAWTLPKLGFAFGALAVFLACALGLIFAFRPDFSVARLTESVTAPEIETQIEAVEQPDASEYAVNVNGENRRVSKKIVSRNRISEPVRRASVADSKRKLPRLENEPEEAFYPLAFAENLEEAKEAGQVIRVELSRSSLLALGVNPPPTDENLKVKTDLLIGSDGVARGIRFVK